MYEGRRAIVPRRTEGLEPREGSIMKTYRAFYPRQFGPDFVMGPVEASCVERAMALLGVRDIAHMQVVEGGGWRWVK